MEDEIQQKLKELEEMYKMLKYLKDVLIDDFG